MHLRVHSDVNDRMSHKIRGRGVLIHNDECWRTRGKLTSNSGNLKANSPPASARMTAKSTVHLIGDVSACYQLIE